MSFLWRFDCHDLPFSVVIEDDDRVAYAYLLEDEKIVGDVWLYNRVSAPLVPEWNDRTKAPFLNPQGFASEIGRPLTETAKPEVVWIRRNAKFVRAEIYFANDLLAVLGPGERPGRSRNALKNGPLAKMLEKAHGT
jgi:hypothetical protein